MPHDRAMPMNTAVVLRVQNASFPTTLRTVALEDATLVYTDLPFETDRTELADKLSDVLDEALDDHEDARGLYVFPTVVQPKARTYDAVIEELGEGGEWLVMEATAPMVSLQEAMASMSEMLPPEMRNGFDQAVQNAGGMEAVVAQAQALLQSDAFRNMFEKAMSEANEDGEIDQAKLLELANNADRILREESDDGGEADEDAEDEK
jgi:hypothetical protein